jgi:hypothetical protein
MGREKKRYEGFNAGYERSIGRPARFSSILSSDVSSRYSLSREQYHEYAGFSFLHPFLFPHSLRRNVPIPNTRSCQPHSLWNDQGIHSLAMKDTEVSRIAAKE